MVSDCIGVLFPFFIRVTPSGGTTGVRNSCMKLAYNLRDAELDRREGFSSSV